MKIKLASVLALALTAMSAQALVVTSVNSNSPATLVNAVVGTGITVDSASINYQGVNGQGGTYTGFSVANSNAALPTLNLSNGIVLGSSFANFSTTTNTTGDRGLNPASGSNTALNTLSGTTTNDANVLSFNFTVATGVNAVSVQFVYGTEEFPTESVTDIFGFFVDGVNYAKFSDGSLVRNDTGNANNATNFQQGYQIEWNGLSSVLTAVGLLNSSLSTHTVSFGVADTDDTIFDSVAFLSSFSAGTTNSGSGGIGVVINPGNGGTGTVPLPGTLALLGLGLFAFARKRA